MIWRFTILNNGETVIPEPEGWDSLVKTIKRDPDLHGLTFNFSDGNVSFSEDAYWIIKEEYILNGVDGAVGLRVEWLCSDCEDYQLFYEGKLDFNRYNEICGDDCKISIGLEASEGEVLITNRMDTPVDLTTNKAYDGTTVLTDYPFLNKDLHLPGKAILIESKAVNDKTVISNDLRNDSQWGIISAQNQSRGQVYPAFTKTILTDISDTSFHDSIELLNGGANNRPSTGLIPVIDFQAFSQLQCVTSFASIKYRFKGKITTAGGAPGATFKIFKLPAGSAVDSFDYQPLASHVIGASGVPFDFNATLNIALNVGDKIYCYIFIIIQNPSDYTSYVVTEDPECLFDVSLHSLCPPTYAKTFFIHEAGSRIIESITNNKYKLKSAYYGREDSMPYSFPSDGCAGLRTITNGLQIRRAVLQDNSSPKVFLSLKDYLESLNAIDCIGMGIEGNDVRVEPIKYFYTDDIIFICDGVNEINTTVRNEWIYNQFSFGYDKFETESTNGLDAMHTKRQYRIQIKNSEVKLEKMCKMIADPYAIEVTRRKFGISEDWRYDQNPFVICCKRNSPYALPFTGSFEPNTFFFNADVSALAVGDVVAITGSALNDGTFTILSIYVSPSSNVTITFAEPMVHEATVSVVFTLISSSIRVDQGNIATPANIFDPATVLNYAITPIRNSLKWFKWIIQGVRDYANSKVLFNAGEGNFVAKGLQNDGCVVEAGVIAENDVLQVSSFADPDDAKPFTVPEKPVFKFPMGLNEFVSISVNPRGKIQYRRFENEDWKFGWIDTLKYSPNDGEAEFTLITSKE